MRDDPASPRDRSRALRIRTQIRKGGAIEPEDATWYKGYEERREAADRKRRAHSMGASASSRTMHIEEHTAAVGVGEAAASAALAASVARAEGQRIDYLVHAGADALIEACRQHRELCGQAIGLMAEMRGRLQQVEDTHMAMLDSVRDHFISRTETEAELVRIQREGADEGENNMANTLMFDMMRQHLGAPPAPPHRPPPPRRPGPPPRPAPPPARAARR